MPNHCYQSVYIQGPRAVVQELYYQLTEHDRFCDTVVPAPLDLFARTKSNGPSMPDWYKWRVENWGTKWDVAEAEIVSDYESDEYDFDSEVDNGKAWFSFRCWTAWAPPVPVWDRLHEMGVTVEAEYQDEGMMFEGEYKHGDDTSWEMLEEEEA